MNRKQKNNMRLFNKKGFTIIEIIICLGIITLIGTISTVVLVKNNKDKNIEKITNNILDAAKVFANIEKDEDGNNYISEIEKGRGGVKIPLSVLVNKGYVKKEDANVIYNEYKNTKKIENNEDYYVLLLDGSESENEINSFYCENNQYQLEASWKIDADKTLYLCNKKVSGGSSSSLSQLLVLNNSVFFNPPNRDNYKDDDRGLYILADYSGEIGEKYGSKYKKRNGYSLYFYGDVDNNYLNFAGETWRIVRINGDGSIRLILNEGIEVKLRKGTLQLKGKQVVSITKTPEEYINIKDLPLKCVQLERLGGFTGQYSDLCFYNYQTIYENDATKISDESILISSEDSSWLYLNYGDADHKNHLFNTYGILSLTTKWYYDNITNTENQDKLETKKYCYSYDESNETFFCEGDTFTYGDNLTHKSSTELRIPLISEKEYIYSTGYDTNKKPHSYLIDTNVDFLFNDLIEFNGKINYYHYNSMGYNQKGEEIEKLAFGLSTQAGNSKYKYKKLSDEWNGKNSVEELFKNNENKSTYYIEKLPALRPVINLKSGLCFKGDGSDSNPYEIIDGTCN